MKLLTIALAFVSCGVSILVCLSFPSYDPQAVSQLAAGWGTDESFGWPLSYGTAVADVASGHYLDIFRPVPFLLDLLCAVALGLAFWSPLYFYLWRRDRTMRLGT